MFLDHKQNELWTREAELHYTYGYLHVLFYILFFVKFFFTNSKKIINSDENQLSRDLFGFLNYFSRDKFY